MDDLSDLPPCVGIVFLICITIITTTIIVCDCAKQKYATPDNVVSTTETTTGIGVSTTDSSTESTTDTSTGR